MWFGGLSLWDRAIYGGGGLPSAEFAFTSAILDPRITFTGNSANRWGFDASGTLVALAQSTPHFDYGPMGGSACRGIRIDTGGVNRCLWNRDFTNVAWTKTNVTAAKNVVGLDGVANSCSTLTATANGGKVTQAFTVTSRQMVTAVYVRRKTGTGTISITLDNGSTSDDVTSQINALTFTQVKKVQTLADPVIGIVFGTSGDEVEVDVAMLVDGAYVGSPILTTTASVTRGRDDLTVTSTNFSSWFNATRGTFVLDFILDEGPSGVATAIERMGLFVDDAAGDIAESILLRACQAGSSSRMALLMRDGNVTQISDSPAGATAAAGTLQRMGVYYEANNAKFAYNGTLGTVDTSVTLPTVTRMVIGGRAAQTEQLTGVVAGVRYWPRVLPDAEFTSRVAL
jgi:hypothetical protein